MVKNSAGIVLQGILDLVVGQREGIALAQLVLVDVVGVHDDHRHTGVLGHLIGELHGVLRVDEGQGLVALEAGAEVETVDARHAIDRKSVV